MKKLLVRIFLALVVIVLIGPTGGYFWVRSIVVSAVEQAVTYGTGQEMTVTKISLHRFGGTMRWNGQMEANPKGSHGWQLTQPCTFDVELELGSLLEDRLVFKKFDLAGLNFRVDFDQWMANGKIPPILDFRKAGGDEPEKEEESGGKKVQVDSNTPPNDNQARGW